MAGTFDGLHVCLDRSRTPWQRKEMTYRRDIRDLQKQFAEQLDRLSAHGRDYDQGRKSAAKDLAVIARLLLRDTQRSKSLLMQIGKKEEISYYATPKLPGLTGMSHLTWMLPYRDGKVEWRPFLSNFGHSKPLTPPAGSGATGVKILGFYVTKSIEEGQENARSHPMTTWLRRSFSEWYNEIILDNGEGLSLTRKGLIDSIADQDGGAHVDEKIEDAAYLGFSRQNAFGWTWSHGEPDHGPEYACMRQVAYELEQTLRDQGEGLFGNEGKSI